MKIGIEKGPQSSKILGNYAEYLVCHWLSCSGFEVCIIDHTGMDIIAYNRRTKLRLGITVKARQRGDNETEMVYIFRPAKPKGLPDRDKLTSACKAFNCEPWVAVYVEREQEEDAHLFLTSLANYDKKYKSAEKAIDAWKMTSKQIGEYEADPEVKHIRFAFETQHWWKSTTAKSAAAA